MGSLPADPIGLKKSGATRRSRTGDLLITNSDKAQNEPEPADKTPQKTED